MKQCFRIFFIFITFIFLLSIPDYSISGVKNGINLCLTALLPSILPFILICNTIMQLNVIDGICQILHPVFRIFFHCSRYGSYCIFIGFLCGYPLGAKVTNELLHDGKISANEANHIIAFANNSGPGYIQNYLILSLLNSVDKRFTYLSFYYVPILLYGMIMGMVYRYDKLDDFKANNIKNDLSVFSLDTCIMDTVRTVCKLCGYVIIFSVISEFVSHIAFLPNWMLGMILMGIEITNGASYVTSMVPNPLLKEILCFCGTIFGGASIFMQTRSVCTQKEIHLRTYLIRRGAIAILAGVYIVVQFLLHTF